MIIPEYVGMLIVLFNGRYVIVSARDLCYGPRKHRLCLDSLKMTNSLGLMMVHDCKLEVHNHTPHM